MATSYYEVSRVRSTAVAVALCVFLSALAAAQAGDVGVESIRADALKGHVYFLAAPEMGGRDSLSLEGRIAANYIAGFFYRLGLKTGMSRRLLKLSGGSVDVLHYAIFSSAMTSPSC